MSTALERDAVQIVRDMVRVASSPAADLGEDGVDERLFAARIEGLATPRRGFIAGSFGRYPTRTAT